MALINDHEIILINRWRGGILVCEKCSLHEPLDCADMYLSLGLWLGVLEILEIEDIGKRAWTYDFSSTEFAGGLLAQSVAIDNEAYTPEAFNI